MSIARVVKQSSKSLRLKARWRLWKRVLNCWKPVVLAGLLLPKPAPAMSYIPMADEALADDADVIVLGEIDQVAPAPGEELDAAYYQVRVETVLKGQVDQRWVSIRRQGGLDPKGEGALIVPGAPQLKAGERAMLFLHHRPDASFEVAQMALGAFHVRTATTGEEVLTRDLDDAEAIGDAAKSARAGEPNAVRRLDRFSRWVHARAAGLDIPTDYWSDATPAEISAAKYLLYTPSQPPRWFEFDRGQNVQIFAGSRGQQSLNGGGYAQVQAAIKAWDSNLGSNVRYAYAGTTGASGGLGRADGVNAVLFNDPNGDIAGSFNCNLGGVLAVSGWRSMGTQRMNSRTFKAIVEVDTVVQDGAGCALSSGGLAAEVLAHELGHTLGLAHPCGDSGLVSCLTNSLLNNALMRPSAHGDGRGATLSADDIAGISYLYPNVVATPPPAPSPPPSGGGTSGGGGAGSGAHSSGGGGAMSGQLLAVMLLLGTVSARRRTALQFSALARAAAPRRRRRGAARAGDQRRETCTSPAPRTA